MSVFTEGELATMQTTQESVMMDTCQILARSTATDAYNQPVESYTAGNYLPCGFKPGSRREVNEAGQVLIADAELRLPMATSLAKEDKIRITKRHGIPLADPTEWQIIGTPAQGPSGLILTLKQVASG